MAKEQIRFRKAGSGFIMNKSGERKKKGDEEQVFTDWYDEEEVFTDKDKLKEQLGKEVDML